MSDSRTAPPAGDRLAKVMARSGLCSRRDAEEWIKAGRVRVNGTKVVTPAFNVTDADEVVVDGTPLAARQGTRVWLYHKPAGLVVTEKDPEGRPTIFEALATGGLPRVLSIGRLDINTEGLLLLTNDGGLKRVLELPATGWLRKYRVRAHGTVTQQQLDRLAAGVEVEGMKYGPIEATLEREQGANVWLEVALREGKNREVKNVLMALGLEVNRLIRVSFGPFQLGDLPIGAVETVKARVLKDQLGRRLAEEAEVDFDSEMPERAAASRRPTTETEERQFGRGTHTVAIAQQRFRFTDRAEKTPAEMELERQQRPRPARPGRGGPAAAHRGPPRQAEPTDEPERRIHFEDGREPTVFAEKTYGAKPKRDDKARAPAGAKRPSRDGARDEPRRAPAGAGARPRPSGDRPRTPRPGADRPHAPRTGDARPERAAGARPRPPRAAATEGAPRPARAFAGKPRPVADGATKRPPRTFAGKPRATDGDAAARPGKPFGSKPARARPPASGPRPPRPVGAEARIARKDGPLPPRSSASADRPPRKDGPRPPRKDGPRPPRKDGPRPPARPRGK